jgi:hypothetical protein
MVETVVAAAVQDKDLDTVLHQELEPQDKVLAEALLTDPPLMLVQEAAVQDKLEEVLLVNLVDLEEREFLLQ